MKAPTTTDQSLIPGDIFVSSHQKGSAQWDSRMTVLEVTEKGVKFLRDHPLYAQNPECFLDWVSLTEKSSWVRFTENSTGVVPRPEDERVTIHEIDCLRVDERPATPGWLSFVARGRIDKNGCANFSIGYSEVEDLIDVLQAWKLKSR